MALFEGSVFNPHTVAALFQQASLSAAIHDGYLSGGVQPAVGDCVAATPLILAGLAVALPYQAGMFNIGGQSQLIGGLISRPGWATASACRPSCTSSSA